RIRISKFGALRIFKGKITDNGVYACRTRTGQYSNMTLIFKSRKNESPKYDVVGKTKQTGGTITAIVQQNNNNMGPVPPRKPQVSTFEGNVLMEELKNYLAANNRIEAYAALSRANTIYDVKFSWDLGPWGPCSLNCSSPSNDKDGGGQQNTGVQSRSVQCRIEIGGHSSYVPDNACEKIVSPKHHQVMLCDVEKCPEWIIGHWSSLHLAI
uniref:Uncharacterized protein n=1 Tax=Romanomermis culicivorax TaxID=13658 RepID=A0A915K6D9_ROMCU